MRHYNSKIVRSPNGHRAPAIFRYLSRAPECCARYVLHENSLGRIELCTGGTLSLLVGGLTLRLPIDALLALHDLAEASLRALDEADRRASRSTLTDDN